MCVTLIFFRRPTIWPQTELCLFAEGQPGRAPEVIYHCIVIMCTHSAYVLQTLPPSLSCPPPPSSTAFTPVAPLRSDAAAGYFAVAAPIGFFVASVVCAIYASDYFYLI